MKQTIISWNQLIFRNENRFGGNLCTKSSLSPNEVSQFFGGHPSFTLAERKIVFRTNILENDGEKLKKKRNERKYSAGNMTNGSMLICLLPRCMCSVVRCLSTRWQKKKRQKRTDSINIVRYEPEWCTNRNTYLPDTDFQ